EAALAQELQDLVMAEAAERIGTGGRDQKRERAFSVVGRHTVLIPNPAGVSGRAVAWRGRRTFEEALGAGVCRQEPLQTLPALRVAGADVVQVRGPLRRVGLLQGGCEDRLVSHGRSLANRVLSNARTGPKLAHGFSGFSAAPPSACNSQALL